MTTRTYRQCTNNKSGTAFKNEKLLRSITRVDWSIYLVALFNSNDTQGNKTATVIIRRGVVVAMDTRARSPAAAIENNRIHRDQPTEKWPSKTQTTKNDGHFTSLTHERAAHPKVAVRRPKQRLPAHYKTVGSERPWESQNLTITFGRDSMSPFTIASMARERRTCSSPSR